MTQLQRLSKTSRMEELSESETTMIEKLKASKSRKKTMPKDKNGTSSTLIRWRRPEPKD
jgi:hypothetical protein